MQLETGEIEIQLSDHAGAQSLGPVCMKNGPQISRGRQTLDVFPAAQYCARPKESKGGRTTEVSYFGHPELVGDDIEELPDRLAAKRLAIGDFHVERLLDRVRQFWALIIEKLRYGATADGPVRRYDSRHAPGS
jgi:hypothetical protein